MSSEGTDFPLVMISAMYENGGNTTHRMLDGHPSLYVYPFESQLGTRLVADHWSALYPLKYRWPEFRLSGDLAEDYRLIIDEECKVRARTPMVSKFRDWSFDMDDDKRRERFLRLMDGAERTRANLVAAFFTATFEVWGDLRRSGRERMWVGYSPIFGIDAEMYLSEMRAGHILHVVRNPWSAYGETKRRPVPSSLQHYLAGWTTLQHAVLAARERFPDRIHIVRFEDLVHDVRGSLEQFCRAVEIDPSELVDEPTWNGSPLAEVYPWGTIRLPTESENATRASELDQREVAEIGRLAQPFLDALGYTRAPVDGDPQ